MPKTNTRRHRRRRQKIQYGAGMFDSIKDFFSSSGAAEAGTALVDQAKATLEKANNKVTEGNAKLAENASGWWESLKNKFSFGSNNNNNEQTGGINASRTTRRRRHRHRRNH
jgi:hypothetical protein